MSSWVLRISKDGDCPTSLGNLFQSPDILFQCVHFASCPVTEHHWEESASIFCTRTAELQVPIPMDRMPPGLLFLRVTSPSPLSFSWCRKCYKPLSIFVKLCWPCISMCFCVLGSSALGPALQRCLIRAEHRGSAGNADGQAGHEPAMCPYSTKGQKSPLQSWFPAWSQPVLVHGVIPPQGQDLALWLFELDEIPVCQFLQPIKIPLKGSITPSSLPPADHIPSFLFLQPTTLN